jgi:hypothetical protein
MQDESRHANRRQDVSDVDLRVHLPERDCRAGAGAEPFEPGEPARDPLVVGDARGENEAK